MIYDPVIRFFYRKWINYRFDNVIDYFAYLEMVKEQNPNIHYLRINWSAALADLTEEGIWEATCEFDNLKELFPEDYLVYLMLK